MAIDTVIQQFAVQVIEAIHTGFILLEAVTIQTVLTVVGVHDQITVFGKTRIVNVFRILIRSLNEQILQRSRPLQFEQRHIFFPLLYV